MRVVAVSYLNTVPFIYGIRQAAPLWLREALSLAVPSACADALKDGTADIALVPVAEIPSIKNAKIITDYCISANGPVDTVALMSDSDLADIHTLYLDNHSRTSVQLARILARELWKIEPRWVCGIPNNKVTQGEAILAIGDKVFEIELLYRCKWDLAEQWKLLTGLPFVFAAWVSRSELGTVVEQELNTALRFGCDHISESIPKNLDYNKAYKYLTQNIQFKLDDSKREAMKLFWEKIITPG